MPTSAPCPATSPALPARPPQALLTFLQALALLTASPLAALWPTWLAVLLALLAPPPPSSSQLMALDCILPDTPTSKAYARNLLGLLIPLMYVAAARPDVRGRSTRPSTAAA